MFLLKFKIQILKNTHNNLTGMQCKCPLHKKTCLNIVHTDRNMFFVTFCLNKSFVKKVPYTNFPPKLWPYAKKEEASRMTLPSLTRHYKLSTCSFEAIYRKNYTHQMIWWLNNASWLHDFIKHLFVPNYMQLHLLFTTSN